MPALREYTGSFDGDILPRSLPATVDPQFVPCFSKITVIVCFPKPLQELLEMDYSDASKDRSRACHACKKSKLKCRWTETPGVGTCLRYICATDLWGRSSDSW